MPAPLNGFSMAPSQLKKTVITDSPHRLTRLATALAMALAALFSVLLPNSVRAQNTPGGASSTVPTFAFYYGANPPIAELSSFDAVVVEPQSGFDPRTAQTPHTAWFAYVSVGEVLASATYYKDLPSDWLIGKNAAWSSILVNQSAPGWPQFYVDHVIAPLWDAGYRGFFLDTLDSYQLYAKTDAERERGQAGVIAVINAIKARYPDAKLIFNRGFELLPKVHDKAYAVAFESLFRGWNQGEKKFTEVPQADRDWLMAQVKTTQSYGLPVISIDYCASADRACARATAAKIRAAGVIPYVTDPLLTTVGVGAIEVEPRRILVLQDRIPRTSLNVSSGLRFLGMPINYLGYKAEYADVAQPLPEGIDKDRYAGIVLWMNNDAPQPRVLRDWISKEIDAGVPIAIFTHFGIDVDDGFASKLGLVRSEGTAGNSVSVESYDPKLMGFEMKPTPDPSDYMPVKVGPAGRSLLRLKSGSLEFDGAAIMPWGGYVMAPFAVFSMSAINQARWVVQPIAFLQQALRLPALPAPDATTENGRRLMMTHIDGDGFASKAEFVDAWGSTYSGEVLYHVVQKYGFPTTASVIEAEVSAQGPFKAYAATLRDVARKMFKLPNVEMASHTYTHPLQWMRVTGLGASAEDSTTEGGSQTDNTGLSYSMPGYTFNIQREIGGSIDYINRELAPPGKAVKVLLWSGDCQVPGIVVKAADDAGVTNMNGGDTIITKSYPSWTAISPLGVMKDGHYQVFAPNQNEELYTQLWQGPYYGFERALETYQLTGEPIRFKAIDVYYHMFTGTKLASVKALETLYDALSKQPLNPIFSSDYAHIVLDFERVAIARDGDTWIVRDAGDLRTVRLAVDQAPDLAGSEGVAGFLPGPGGVYVHLSGPEARFKVIHLTDAHQGSRANLPYLADANGSIENFKRTPQSLSFDLHTYLPPEFSIAGAASCRVSANGRTLQSTLDKTGAHARQYVMERSMTSNNPVQVTRVNVDCSS